MRNFAIPKINDWDRAIMDTYPHRVADLWSNPDNFERFSEIIIWTKLNLDRDSFTWKSMTFFFKDRNDMMHFILRWV